MIGTKKKSGIIGTICRNLPLLLCAALLFVMGALVSEVDILGTRQYKVIDMENDVSSMIDFQVNSKFSQLDAKVHEAKVLYDELKQKIEASKSAIEVLQSFQREQLALNEKILEEQKASQPSRFNVNTAAVQQQEQALIEQQQQVQQRAQAAPPPPQAAVQNKPQNVGEAPVRVQGQLVDMSANSRSAHKGVVEKPHPYFAILDHPEDKLAATPELCKHCLWSNRDRGFVTKPDSKMVFVRTGDIPEMWIRDSSAQVHPYVLMSTSNSTLEKLVEGVVLQQAFFIKNNSYANSYRPELLPRRLNQQEHRLNRTGWIGTYNYEMDSGSYFFRLLFYLWRAVGAPESSALRDPIVKEAVWNMLRTWRVEQHHENLSPYRYVELARQGLGSPTSYTGMSWTGFRPSDDPCIYHYHVPDNLFAVSTLKYVEELAEHVWKDEHLFAEASALREDIYRGVHQHAVRNVEGFGDVYCYEVDGEGNCAMMDDANIPSLLSIPYLDPLSTGYDARIYENTRRFILSEQNPFYFAGKFAHGIGSPHTPRRNAWHMAIIMQGLTSQNQQERLWALHTTQQTTADAGTLHESFNVDNPTSFTRAWFGWPNALYAELWHSIYGSWCDEKEMVDSTVWEDDPEQARPIASYAHLNPVDYELLEQGKRAQKKKRS